MPYSRGASPPADAVAEASTELLEIAGEQFPELIRECPVVTATLVHAMVDRARKFTSGDHRDEKLISLGKLAAGLAHELNNPASAAVRSAKALTEGLASAEAAARRLGARAPVRRAALGRRCRARAVPSPGCPAGVFGGRPRRPRGRLRRLARGPRRQRTLCRPARGDRPHAGRTRHAGGDRRPRRARRGTAVDRRRVPGTHAGVPHRDVGVAHLRSRGRREGVHLHGPRTHPRAGGHPPRHRRHVDDARGEGPRQVRGGLGAARHRPPSRRTAWAPSSIRCG